MDAFEEEIRAALRPAEPSPDFTDRVLARVAATPARRPSRMWTRWVAAMAASVVLAAGVMEYRQYEGERAKSQVMLAMRIAAVKLNKAQKRVHMLNSGHRSI